MQIMWDSIVCAQILDYIFISTTCAQKLDDYKYRVAPTAMQLGTLEQV